MVATYEQLDPYGEDYYLGPNAQSRAQSAYGYLENAGDSGGGR